jgi:hypothetical protein
MIQTKYSGVFMKLSYLIMTVFLAIMALPASAYVQPQHNMSMDNQRQATPSYQQPMDRNSPESARDTGQPEEMPDGTMRPSNDNQDDNGM